MICLVAPKIMKEIFVQKKDLWPKKRDPKPVPTEFRNCPCVPTAFRWKSFCSTITGPISQQIFGRVLSCQGFVLAKVPWLKTMAFGS